MPSNISVIYEQECIGDSLVKINNNFVNLDNSVVALSGTLSNAINETAFRAASAKYEDTYLTVSTLSTSWAIDSTADTEIRALSSAWQSTYTTVQNNSASWEESVDIANLTTTIQNTSGNWNIAYNVATSYQTASSTFATNSTVNTISSQLTLTTTTNILTGLLTPLTTTNTLTSQLLPTSIYQNASSNIVFSNSTFETPTTGLSTVNNFIVLTQATYNALTIKNPNTLYFIVSS